MKRFPALTFGVLGALAIPLIQWLVTKEITLGAALLAIVPIVTGALTHTQVTPVAAVEPRVAEAALETAKRLDAATVGPGGQITAQGTREATAVVGQVLRTTPTRAGELVQATLKGDAA